MPSLIPFIDEYTEAQKDKVTFVTSHSKIVSCMLSAAPNRKTGPVPTVRIIR